MSESSFQSIDHLFRRTYGQLVAQFTARYSSRYIDLIEDAVQEALIKAMRVWPFSGGEPANPEGWLYRVANNHLIDQMRRNQRSVGYDAQVEVLEQASNTKEEFYLEGELEDEQLKMIFACCHPELNEKERLILSLKLLGGLGTREIATALLKKPEAIKKAITRAKEKFRDKVGHLSVPHGAGLKPRLYSVLRVIYLMFNEGYKASEGEFLIKKEICDEAIRLALILEQHPNCNIPELNALIALMYFNASRFGARIDATGNLVTLENQDRELWDKNMINWGMHFINKAAQGVVRSEYHFLAGIASFYATAESFQKTNWESILLLYDWLIHFNPNPMAALNRIVVVEKVKGAEKALEELETLSNTKEVKDHYLFHAIRADLYFAKGNIEAAISSLKAGIELAGNALEKRFMENKLDKAVETKAIKP